MNTLEWFKRYSSVILLIGDLIALLIFVLVGERSHELDQTNFLMTTLPFIVPWIIAGYLLGAFPNADAITPRKIFGAAINAWFVVTPLGLFLRALVLNRPDILVPFYAAAFGFSGLFVLAWRLVFFVVWRFAK